MYLAEGVEIPVFQGLGFTLRNVELLSQSVGAQSVGKAIAHGFYMAALVTGNLIHRHAIDHRGHIFMEVRTGAECLDQSLIARQIGHNTQFDLRIVAAHQRLIAFSRHKHTTNLTSDRITVGNILQIRVHRAQSALFVASISVCTICLSLLVSR